jgi:SPOR domain
MTNQLVQELSERLERTGPEVEKALTAFAAAVQDKVQADGFANLAGLGTVRRENDALGFEPSRALQQAVNYRWLPEDDSVAVTPKAKDEHPVESSDQNAPAVLSGLNDSGTTKSDHAPIRKVSWAPIVGADPTELTGIPTAEISPHAASPSPRAEPASPPAPAPPPTASTPPPAPTPLAAAPAPPPTAQAAPEPPAPPEPVDPGLYAPVSDEKDLTYESLHSHFAPTSGASAPVADAFADPSTSDSYDDSLASAMAAAAPADARTGTSSSPHETSGNWRPLLFGLAGVALIVASFFVIRGWASSMTDPAPAELSAAEASTAGRATGNIETAAGLDDGGPAESTPPTEQPAALTVNPGRTPTGTPTSIDLTSSGYTLVVGSSTSLAGARAAMNRHANLGHPVGLLSYPDADGQLRHRIGVGEFATSEEADALRRSLADQLPEGTWVRRIRR